MRKRLRPLCLIPLLAFAGCSGEGPGLTGVGGGAAVSVEQQGSTASAFAEPTKSEGGIPQVGDIPDPTAGGRKVIENPTPAEILQAGPLPEMALGRADAPVTVVQYASLTCPHCREFHEKTFPEFKRTYVDTGKVRFILREFPIGKQSGQATVALRCAKPEKYFDLYGKFMREQASWVSQEVRLDPIFAVAKQVGITRAEFDACYQNQAMIDGLKWVKERGRTLGIIGTPNFFIGGKLVKSPPTMADLRAAIDPLLAASGVTASAATAVPR